MKIKPIDKLIEIATRCWEDYKFEQTIEDKDIGIMNHASLIFQKIVGENVQSFPTKEEVVKFLTPKEVEDIEIDCPFCGRQNISLYCGTCDNEE